MDDVGRLPTSCSIHMFRQSTALLAGFLSTYPGALGAQSGMVAPRYAPSPFVQTSLLPHLCSSP
jgi:hypothetical protein